jgi:DinB superfamily
MSNMASISTHPEQVQLAALRQQFNVCSAAAEKLIASISENKLNLRTSDNAWSIAECIAHLTSTTALYLPILRTALMDAPAGDGPYKMDWRGRMLKWVLEPPYRTKVKTIPSLEPRLNDPRRVLPDFLASQQEFLSAMQMWNGRALDKVFIASLFNERFRYNMFSLFNVAAAHQRRHLWQAQCVKDTLQG